MIVVTKYAAIIFISRCELKHFDSLQRLGEGGSDRPIEFFVRNRNQNA